MWTRKADSLDEALAMIEGWTKAGEAKSVALMGNAADVFPELVKRGVQTRYRDRPDLAPMIPCNGYLPQGWSMARLAGQAGKRPQGGGESCARKHR